MRITDLGNMLNITAQPGFILRNIEDDTRCYELYTSKTFDLSVLEEIIDNDPISRMCADIDFLIQKERSLNKMGKAIAKQITDDAMALELSDFYEEWIPGISYKVNEYLTYNTILYKTLTPHVSQMDWKPDVTPSLYAKILVDPTGETVLDWVQPDSTNAYMKGDKVKFEGHIYESLIDNNIWSPSAYPAGWKLVE